ncbi:hypothetical protein EDD64_11253 [Effusibacillus lacus]|nr:hypothetical protein EDD64_11253 [Effusibacillus lacus]
MGMIMFALGLFAFTGLLGLIFWYSSSMTTKE